MTGLTPLETAVLQEHCRQLAPADAAALEMQIQRMSVLRRENTGAGSFTYLSTVKDAAPPIKADPRGCYVTAKINGVENALGFILWVKDGYVDVLEGYTMALPGTADIDFASIDLELGSLSQGAG